MEKRTLKVAAILLASAERASQLAGHLQQQGVDAIPALGSDHFHRIVNQRRIDLVIIEHQLQGFLSGLEILERMHGELIRPPVLLVAPTSPELTENARRLQVARVMPTDTPLATLASAGKSILAANQDPWNTLLPREARLLVSTASGVSDLPPLLPKLCSWLDQTPASLDLGFRVSANPWFSAELLRMTGTARNHPATSVEEALQLLGPQRSISLLAAAGLLAAQLPWLRDLPPELRRWIYGRSVLIGSTAACFAPILGCRAPEAAFVLGLIQDSGIGLVASIYGDTYTTLLERARSIGPLRLEACEQQALNMSHADVTSALLTRWSLPGWLAVTSLCHHQPEAQLPAAQRKLLRAVQIGEAVANLADCRTSQRQQRLLDLLTELDGDGCYAAISEIIAHVPVLCAQLALPPTDLTGVEWLLNSLQNFAGRWEIPASAEKPPVDPPANDSQVASDPATNRPALAATSNPTLLVIDDEASIKTIKFFLAETEISVLACSDLQTARQLAPQAEVILCEVHQPQESGPEIVAALRTAGYRHPILMASNDCRRETVLACADLGVDDYLIKPFSKSLLMEKLRRHADLPHRDLALRETSAAISVGFAPWVTSEAAIRG